MTDEQLEQYVKAKTDLAEALAILKAIDTYARHAGMGAWRQTVSSMSGPVVRKHQ